MSTIINDKREAQRQEEKTYHVGQWFDYLNNLWILSPVGENMAVLVSPRKNTAYYYRDAIKVKDISKITQQEFDKISHGLTLTPVQVEINILNNL